MYVRHMIGETAQPLADIREIGKSSLLTFNCDSIAVVEGLTENGLTAKHIRFVCKDRGLQGLRFAKASSWPRMRRILKNEERFNVPGGLKYALIYPEEILIADYAISGSHGWIVRRKDIGRILSENPLTESQLCQLREKLVELETEKESLLTDAKLREEAGNTLFHIKTNQDKDIESWWVRVTVFWESSQKTFGFNEMKESGEGELSYYAHGWSRHVKYKSIPRGAVDIIYDDIYRWLCLFDGASFFVHDVNKNDDPFSQQMSGFERVKIEFMGGEDGLDIIQTEEVSREDAKKNILSRERFSILSEKMEKIRRTLQREGGLQ